MRLHTFEDIQRAVTPAALEKATLYQRRRQAFVTDMADDGTRIEGRVQGTQRRPYSVTIELAIRPDGKVPIDGSCSCPVGFNCKHVAALLIESMRVGSWRRRPSDRCCRRRRKAGSPTSTGRWHSATMNIRHRSVSG